MKRTQACMYASTHTQTHKHTHTHTHTPTHTEYFVIIHTGQKNHFEPEMSEESILAVLRRSQCLDVLPSSLMTVVTFSNGILMLLLIFLYSTSFKNARS